MDITGKLDFAEQAESTSRIAGGVRNLPEGVIVTGNGQEWMRPFRQPHLLRFVAGCQDRAVVTHENCKVEASLKMGGFYESPLLVKCGSNRFRPIFYPSIGLCLAHMGFFEE